MRVVIFCLIVVFVMSGCGAIMHGSSQDISINSSPTEAKTLVSGEERTTPAKYNLKRKHSYLVKISKEGYETAEVMINNKLDWTAWVDIFVWGVIPVFYDLATGCAWKLSPEEITVSLTRSIGSMDGPENIPVILSVRDDHLNASATGTDVTVTITQID